MKPRCTRTHLRLPDPPGWLLHSVLPSHSFISLITLCLLLLLLFIHLLCLPLPSWQCYLFFSLPSSRSFVSSFTLWLLSSSQFFCLLSIPRSLIFCLLSYFFVQPTLFKFLTSSDFSPIFFFSLLYSFYLFFSILFFSPPFFPSFFFPLPLPSSWICHSQLLSRESVLRECHHWRHPAFHTFPRPASRNKRHHTHTDGSHTCSPGHWQEHM